MYPSSLYSSVIKFSDNPFISRPWLKNKSAATSHDNLQIKGLICGGLTGAIQICITYPSDYVKVQLQLDGKASAGKQFSGIWDCVTKTLKTHGFFGLYRGLSVVINGVVAKLSVRFSVFETVKHYSIDETGNFTAKKKIFAGFCAGFCEAIFVVTPADSIKVKFINDRRSTNPRFQGIFHGISVIIKENGFKGLYQGLLPTIMKNGSSQALRFFVVETFKDRYTEGDKTKSVPKPLVGFFGTLAGVVSVLGNAPIDVLKTRMQGLDSAKYKNTWDCVVQTWKMEGLRAFYKGTIPRLSGNCVEVAVTFMIYDSLIEYFNNIESK